jgi:integrase
MKAGREHRIPLSAPAAAVLELLRSARMGPFVFPGRRRDKHLSTMSLAMLLRMLGVKVTVHGFRSSFRDWCGDATSFPREVAEAALAHAVGNATELAYRRSDALERRRALMDAWASYCDSEARAPSNVVVPLRKV